MSDIYWDEVISLLHFDVDFTDMAGFTTWETPNGAVITNDNDPIWGNALQETVSTQSNIRALSWSDVPDLSKFTLDITYTPDNFDDISGLFIWGDGSVPSANNFRFYVNADGTLRFTLASGGSNIINVQSTGALTIGQRHQLRLVLDGTNVLIFIDGILDKTQAYTVPSLPGANEARIGFMPFVSDSEFRRSRGDIDEFRMTNAVRSTSNYLPASSPFPNGPPDYSITPVYPVYPVSFPCPNWSFSDNTVSFALRTSYDCGWTRQRLRWPSHRQTNASMSFTMDAYMFHKWSTWLDANAEQWFNIEIDGTMQTVRMISGPSYSYSNFDRIDATIEAEIKDG